MRDHAMRDDDVNLPWQYVLLGFFVFGALAAVPFLVISFIPGQLHDRDVGWVRATTIIYLSAGLGAAPWLLRTGRRRFSKVNPDGRTLAGSLKKPPPRMSRQKRLVVSSLILAVGVLATAFSYSQVATTGGIYTVYLGLMGTGLVGVISALLAESD